MDNLAIHKTVKVNGTKVFTPVAQPYANPVEIIFSKVLVTKDCLQKNNMHFDFDKQLGFQ